MATLAAMRVLGAAQVAAVLGPSICGGCYEVPADRIAQVRAAVGDAIADTCVDGRRLDVAAGVRGQLADAGVTVHVVAGCTAEDPGLFSFRRDGVTGRQGMMVWR